NALIKFFLNFQRLDSLGKDSAVLLAQSSVAYSGQLSLDFAPAEVPMFEHVVDSTNKIIKGVNGQTAHVTGFNYGRQGVVTKCVGCHAGHTTITVPVNVTEGQFFNTSTSASVTQSSYKFVNDSIQFPGKKVIDRKVQNDTLMVNWISNGTTNEYVNLKWDVPLDIRWIKLYNVKPNPANNTNIQVTDCEIIVKYLSNEIYRITSTGPISLTGTQFNIPNFLKFDEIRVIVKSYNGTVNGENHSALAEVETNARISFYEIIGIKKISSVAGKFSLGQNFPNPFNPITKIRFNIPPLEGGRGRNISLIIYDILGKEVATLVNELLKPGTYEVQWNGNNFASGIYFYRLTAGDASAPLSILYTDVKKMILLK
ncbi:MAG TPA: T9SS type A sorting domain-containing protein, partial [Ignavibacteria bacterium]|nr:T9SS type A sorting domain-containing protein [Ignavibacteria bacterium]